MSIRTDLITEQKQLHAQDTSDVQYSEEILGNTKIETVFVRYDSESKILSKPKGKYITVSFGNILNLNDTEDIENAISKALSTLMPKIRENVLVVGLGNTDITPDAIGPLTVDGLLATRHIEKTLAESLGLAGIKKV